MEEKRKLKRRYLIYPVRVFDPDNNQLIGFLENITTQGMMLKSGRPCRTMNMYRLKMRFGDEIHRSGHFEFSAECKWWDKDILTGFFNTGFHLEDVSSEGFQVLDKIIHGICCDEKEGTEKTQG